MARSAVQGRLRGDREVGVRDVMTGGHSATPVSGWRESGTESAVNAQTIASEDMGRLTRALEAFNDIVRTASEFQRQSVGRRAPALLTRALAQQYLTIPQLTQYLQFPSTMATYTRAARGRRCRDTLAADLSGAAAPNDHPETTCVSPPLCGLISLVPIDTTHRQPHDSCGGPVFVRPGVDVFTLAHPSHNPPYTLSALSRAPISRGRRGRGAQGSLCLLTFTPKNSTFGGAWRSITVRVPARRVERLRN
jgi:hypothetical protein